MSGRQVATASSLMALMPAWEQLPISRRKLMTLPLADIDHVYGAIRHDFGDLALGFVHE